MGKTSTRGHKGAGARSGYKRRYGYEGGQMRLFMKLPKRGFTRGRFLKKSNIELNLSTINELYNDGDVVNLKTLLEKKYFQKNMSGVLKILAKRNLEKKVSIEANKFSKTALTKLDEKKIKYKVVK